MSIHPFANDYFLRDGYAKYVKHFAKIVLNLRHLALPEPHPNLFFMTPHHAAMLFIQSQREQKPVRQFAGCWAVSLAPRSDMSFTMHLPSGAPALVAKSTAQRACRACVPSHYSHCEAIGKSDAWSSPRVGQCILNKRLAAHRSCRKRTQSTLRCQGICLEPDTGIRGDLQDRARLKRRGSCIKPFRGNAITAKSL
jgi:hypothetical protein